MPSENVESIYLDFRRGRYVTVTEHGRQFLFWLPLIFYKAIKAETEFVTVLNQLTKGSLVAFTLHWLMDVKGITALMGGERRTPAIRGRERARPDKRVAGRELAEHERDGQ